jgi:NAD(P)H-dependent FMN reductase
MKASQIRVLLFLGCLSNISRARTLVESFEALLCTRGAIPYLWDLYYEPLPMPNLTFDYTHQDCESKNVEKLVQLADEADSFVWYTPFYHNSFSDTLKNALDHLDTDHFRKKTCCLYHPLS